LSGQKREKSEPARKGARCDRQKNGPGASQEGVQGGVGGFKICCPRQEGGGRTFSRRVKTFSKKGKKAAAADLSQELGGAKRRAD